jgi:hypothetical protein
MSVDEIAIVSHSPTKELQHLREGSLVRKLNSSVAFKALLLAAAKPHRGIGRMRQENVRGEIVALRGNQKTSNVLQRFTRVDYSLPLNQQRSFRALASMQL